METFTLSNGVKMPKLGYGVYLVTPEEAERCVLDAIETGYRLIDTAQFYMNEKGVGNAIKKCGLPREELFITTKTWIHDNGYERAKAAIERSLKNLQTDYIDLMLIHQPYGDIYGTWRAYEEAYEAGKLRAIGVSNFYADRLIDLCAFARIKPMVNQVETHVFFQQKIGHKYMEKYGVKHQSWAPFAEGANGIFTNPLLAEIGAKYGKSNAQVALRFLLQNDVMVIPKSVRKERMAENANVFDFTLSDEDMQRISTLDTGKSLFHEHVNPAQVEWFVFKSSEGLE